MQTPQITPGSPQLIAMVHVHSNNALTNTAYNNLFGIKTYGTKDLEIIDHVRKEMARLSEELIAETGMDILRYCRNASFILRKDAISELENKMGKIEFVKEILERAVKEVEIYTRNGINIVGIENIGAPYFIGNEVPLEDLLIISMTAKAVRAAFPHIHLGTHILSSDELESLPIALSSGAFFVRSESSIFSGFRPEGKTINRGNLAKFYYLRNYFNAKNGIDNPEQRRFPFIWSDFQKKHTVFEQEITDLKIWLDNILFQKIEGVILTGAETGTDIAEKDLASAREAIKKLQEKSGQISGYQQSLEVPLITGSGMDLPLYKKYADFIITGTQLKKNKYWENEVDEENVKVLVEKVMVENR